MDRHSALTALPSLMAAGCHCALKNAGSPPQELLATFQQYLSTIHTHPEVGRDITPLFSDHLSAAEPHALAQC